MNTGGSRPADRNVALRIEIDKEKCMGSGNCSFWAPGTFDLGDDGIACVIDPGGDPVDKVLLAASGCPTQAIEVWDGDEKLA
jgi:ferredoxin